MARADLQEGAGDDRTSDRDRVRMQITPANQRKLDAVEDLGSHRFAADDVRSAMREP